MRWHQFGSVCPLYRSHGTTPREPWAYGPEAEASITKSIDLRASLKTYTMELAANATKFGTIIMAPLWFHFPGDVELHRREFVDSFMYGPRYLAAPVLERGLRNRTVYLPTNPNGWVHYYSRAKFAGGANVTVPAPLDELTLFIRQ
eukprot:SAG31_NODE_2413_length_5741_cov_8.901099_3_plen_146_part_00